MTLVPARLKAFVWTLRPISLFLLCLASQGHLAEEATTIINLLSVPYFKCSKYVLVSYLLWNLSYSLYLCWFITFKIPFPSILEGLEEVKEIKSIYTIYHVEHEVSEIQFKRDSLEIVQFTPSFNSLRTG